ncbi:GNAT family N-acetyltransferase [Variovorax dokdonensis]|uniref:GNAT family N-acetyltransferase n=1 Tax=Variovorax dokdonensis TaxID=344883 RepID=A0ABT7N9J9_9BURK|nr:GNAT family N-acetyltransferase [Variovorax dokdonensis]MDM0044540.1 GNAT family N-acetyltransferase [Variovorax dokdonensis]
MNRFVTITTSNITDFAGVYQEVFNSPPWSDGWSRDAVLERLESFAEFPSFLGWGLIREGSPVGFALGWGERWVNGWTFQLKEMCITQQFQSKGLGRALLETATSELRGRGFRSINLVTGRSSPAAAFYEHVGFGEQGLVSLHRDL